MKVDLIEACTDLGLFKKGASLGPKLITKGFEDHPKIEHIVAVSAPMAEKETGDIKLKNGKAVNDFNEQLYKVVSHSIENGNLPITIGRRS